MRVKLKSTGQYGTIPDDKFDSNLFEKADIATSSSITKPKTTQSYKMSIPSLANTPKYEPNIVEKAVNLLLPRTTNWVGQYMAERGTGAGLNHEQNVKLQKVYKNLTDSGAVKSTVEGGKNLGSDPFSYLWKQKENIAPVAGEIAPYVIMGSSPLGSSTKIAGKTVLPTFATNIAKRAGEGFVSGALHGYTDPLLAGSPLDINKERVEKALSEGKTGAVISGAFQTLGEAGKGVKSLVGKVKGKGGIGETEAKLGKWIRNSQYRVPAGYSYNQKLSQNLDELSNYGLNNFDDIVTTGDKVHEINRTLIQDSVTKSKPVDVNGVLDMAKDLADDEVPVSKSARFFKTINKKVTELFKGKPQVVEPVIGSPLATVHLSPKTGAYTQYKGVSKEAIQKAIDSGLVNPSYDANLLNAEPNKTWDLVKYLEKKGWNILRPPINTPKYTIAPDDMAEANAYLKLADELRDRLFLDKVDPVTKAQRGGADKIMINLRNNPTFMESIKDLPKAIQDRYLNAKTIGEIRNIEAPFVTASKAINLTEAEALSKGMNLSEVFGRITPAKLLQLLLKNRDLNLAVGNKLIKEGAKQTTRKAIPDILQKSLGTLPNPIENAIKSVTENAPQKALYGSIINILK